MSRMRQSQPQPAEEDVRIRTLSIRYASGFVIHTHSHDWDQLVFAYQGVMTVRTSTGYWVVPPQRAVWVPAGVDHEIEMSGSVAMRTLYLQRGLSTAIPHECAVLNVSPLLRELILHATRLGMLSAGVPPEERMIGVILDQLDVIAFVPLSLPMPRDSRAVFAANLMRENPGERYSLSAMSRNAGASKRTIERLFVLETQMSVGKWRQQARLLEGLRLLAQGLPVTTVALQVGYDSPSAFVFMFKRILGTTPSRYYAEQRRPATTPG